jgi:hypothetical protein
MFENLKQWAKEKGECRVTKVHFLGGYEELRKRLIDLRGGEWMVLIVHNGTVRHDLRIDKNADGMYKLNISARVDVVRGSLGDLFKALDGFLRTL